jgi:hypothetical protein
LALIISGNELEVQEPHFRDNDDAGGLLEKLLEVLQHNTSAEVRLWQNTSLYLAQRSAVIQRGRTHIIDLILCYFNQTREHVQTLAHVIQSTMSFDPSRSLALDLTFHLSRIQR